MQRDLPAETLCIALLPVENPRRPCQGAGALLRSFLRSTCDVPPSDAGAYRVNARATHPVLAPKFCVRFVTRQYAKNVFLGQLGFGVPLPECGATLGDHVGHVLVVCAEEKVARIDAAPVVAGVANVKGRQFAIGEPPSRTMRADFATQFAVPNKSVTQAVQPALPRPALVGPALVDATPEAVSKRGPHYSFPFPSMASSRARNLRSNSSRPITLNETTSRNHSRNGR